MLHGSHGSYLRRNERAARPTSSRVARGTTVAECLEVDETLRVGTYNVRGCIGLDRRYDPERIGDVLVELGCDIVGLQEVDVGRRRSHAEDQAHVLARRLGFVHAFGAALWDSDAGAYGNAVLSRWPIVSETILTLPGVSGWRCEPRCSIEAVVATPWGQLTVWCVHLGIRSFEKLRQGLALVTELARSALSRRRFPLAICGDLNAGPSSALVRALRARLVGARAHGFFIEPTYPSWWPVLSLDHVFVSPPLDVVRGRSHASPAATVASDHLPFVADVSWSSRAAGGPAGA
jgi:endonuclease/exonuclease/phosphatase family metal-dependent hydrolase